MDRLQVFLQITSHLIGQKDPLPPNFSLGAKLLPPPQQAQVLAERASVIVLAGQTSQAVALYREALKLVPEFEPAANALARILATSSDPTIRNGNEALDWLHKVATFSHSQTAESLELLAYASATAGKFDDAEFYARQAAQLYDNIGRSPAADTLRKRMELFHNHQAYLEP
jgi:Flp pilus assembly protein TadD